MNAIIGIFVIIQIVNVFSRNLIEITSYKKTIEAGIICGQKMNTKILRINFPEASQQIPEDDPRFSEIMDCLWREMNLIDQNSRLNEEAIISFFDDLASAYDGTRLTTRTDIVDIINFCKTLKGANIGYTAIKVQNCINKHYQARVLLAQLLGFINRSRQKHDI